MIKYNDKWPVQYSTVSVPACCVEEFLVYLYVYPLCGCGWVGGWRGIDWPWTSGAQPHPARPRHFNQPDCGQVRLLNHSTPRWAWTVCPNVNLPNLAAGVGRDWSIVGGRRRRRRLGPRRPRPLQGNGQHWPKVGWLVGGFSHTHACTHTRRAALHIFWHILHASTLTVNILWHIDRHWCWQKISCVLRYCLPLLTL